MQEGHQSRKRFVDEYRLELVGGAVLLVVTALLPFIGAPEEAVWSMGLMSVVLPLAVGALKAHNGTTLFSLTRQWHDTYGRASRLHSAIAGLSGVKLQHAHRIVDRATHDIERARDGFIPLDPSAYYHNIIEQMRLAPAGSKVYAVSCIDLLRWREDPRQRRYLRENKVAADRGVEINRICIVERSALCGPEATASQLILREQLEHERIVVRLVYREQLAEVSERVRDWVLFTAPEQRLFVDYPDQLDSTRVLRAELVLDPATIEKYVEDFRVLSEYALTEEESAAAFAAISTQVGVPPQRADTPARLRTPPQGRSIDGVPSIRSPHRESSAAANSPAPKRHSAIKSGEPIRSMAQEQLASPVISCEEAAAAKNIPLENELKTLILTTGYGFVALEVPGDARADLRAVKDALATQEAFMASEQELASLGLEPGTVCAVREPVWSMTHLVSRRVLGLDYVSTNAGSRTQYVRFKPSVLLDAQFVLVGDFESVVRSS